MTTAYCPQCGNEVSPESQYCGNCGSSMVVVRAGDGTPTAGASPRGGCSNCGEVNRGKSLFCQACAQFLIGDKGVKVAGLGRRVGAFFLDIVLILVTLIIGYIIWWLFTLRHGQTPGKQLLGIRVVRTDGTPSRWGWTFIREFVIKGVVVGILDSVLVVAGIVDLLWAFWDKDRQTLHDKIMKTVVVDDREFRHGELDEAPATT